MRLTTTHAAIGITTALVLAACGGGSGGGSSATSSAPAATAAAAHSTSSGTLTAFGSVFVNGHEFSTASAKVFDDDVSSSSSATLSNTNASSSGLTVGMTVDVKAAEDSSSSAPHAGEIHIHPLARGYIDASDATAGTLQIMGQTVAVSSSTVFRDDRACVSASTSPCTPITAQSGLLATDQSCAVSGSGFQNQGGGSTFTPGRYAQVFGLISTSSSGASTIQATLVRLLDAGTTPIFKAEGSITTVGMGTPPASFTLGGLSLDTSAACTASSSCAFSAGTLVAARGTATPTISCGASGIAVSFKPNAIAARHATTLTSGATVELEGLAANVVSTTTPATFTLDGVTIQVGSGLTLPAAGDRVEVLGTVNSDLSIAATSISTEESHRQQSTPFLIQDTLASGSVTGSAAPYDLSILGTHVVLDAHTRFVDRTVSMGMMSGSNPFNVMTAASYLNGLSSPTVVVVGYQDTSTTPATFHAVALEIVTPTTSDVRLGGVVTGAVGTGSSLQVDGLPVTVASGSTTVTGITGTPTLSSIALGDFVLVTGSEARTGSTVTGVNASAIKDFGNNPMHGD